MKEKIKKYLGVDIGGTAVKLGIVTQNGDVLHQNTYDTTFDNYETPIIETVVKSIKEFLNDNTESLEGIGVSATGQIDVHSGTVIGVCGSIKNWEGCNIRDRLEAEFKLKTTVINDANAVAIAEQWCGRAKGADDVLVVTIGTGVGGGIISGGKILMGQVGIGGEIGHFTIKYDGETCTCGNKGCLERYASTTALVRKIKADANLVKDLGMTEVNGKTIFDNIGDQRIFKAVDEWIDCLAAGLVGLTHILNPQMIIVGGGVSREKDLFIAPLRKKVLGAVMKRFSQNLSLEAATLGNTAGTVGAVGYFISVN